MKAKKLLRYLIKIGIIFFIIILLAGGGFFFVSSENTDLIDEVARLKAESGGIEAKYRALELQLKDASQAWDNYRDFDKSRDGSTQNFRREFARNLLGELRDQDMIKDLQFSMEPFSKGSKLFERVYVAVFKSKITVQFSADTDIDVFNLIKDISQSFPGNVEIISYDITRSREIDEQALLAIGEGSGRDSLVKGELIFEWQGIQDNLDSKKEAISDPLKVGKP